MALVENELTQKNVERAQNHPELEKYKEIEHKLVPKHPEILSFLYKDIATPIEQIYLSTPDDEFDVRVRCHYTPDGIEYTASQKDRGILEGAALKRSEISTPISAEAFEYYQAMDLPRVLKQRAEVTEGVTIDFFDDSIDPVVVEVEHNNPTDRQALLAHMQEITEGTLVDRSGDKTLSNEFRAYRGKYGEHLKQPESLDVFSRRVLGEMIAQYTLGKNQVVVGLTGMSGSGKTTVTEWVQEQVAQLYGEAFKPIVISTDDYHFGKKQLELTYGAPYTEWDAAQTYDTAAMTYDLAQLREGTPLLKRHFDFEKEEVVVDEELPLSPFIIIEGLYAGSKDLESVRDLHFELPTSIATSIGRDVRRLMIDNRANRAFPDAPSRLRYQIESAIPRYLSIEQPPKPSFSACSRPLAERAFMLTQLRETLPITR